MSTEGLTGGAIARGLGGEGRVRWPLRRASDLFELRYGKALVASSRGDGVIPVFGTNGQTGTHDESLFEGPGVIIGRKGAGHLGVHWSSGDFWVIDTAYSLVPSSDIHLKFAYYLIEFVGLNHLKHGTSNPSLTREAFGAQYFPVPPIDTQRAIAATLGALDDKIESNRRIVHLAHELLDGMAEARCGSLPTSPLGSLSGLTRATVSPSVLGDAVVDHYSLPAFDSLGRAERVRASIILSNKIRLAEPAVLVSRLNPRTNRTWWAAPAAAISALASTEFAVLTAQTELELGAIWLAVRHPSFLEELPRRVTGTSGSHQRVRPDDLLAIEVPDVRQLDDATKEATLILLRLAHQHTEESARLSDLRDSLMPELLSGRIRVPEAADVVQDVLNESESA